MKVVSSHLSSAPPLAPPPSSWHPVPETRPQGTPEPPSAQTLSEDGRTPVELSGRVEWREGGREGGREGWRRKGEREGGNEGGQGGREGGRK